MDPQQPYIPIPHIITERPRTTITPNIPNLNIHDLQPLQPRETPAQTAISLAGLDTGTKVGIIIGITVIAILILIGGGLGILSCRNMRRRRREREAMGNGEDPGLEMDRLKAESERKRGCKAIGLWDNLKIGEAGDGGERRGGRSEVVTGEEPRSR
jgi:hypothetical protein